MSDERIKELLKRVGAFKVKENASITRSGDIKLEFEVEIMPERLAGDNSRYLWYKNPQEVISHAVRLLENQYPGVWPYAKAGSGEIEWKEEIPVFTESIDLISETAQSVLSDSYKACAIYGNQKRDWLFSGPVAKELCIPSISLDEEGKAVIIYRNGVRDEATNLSDYEILPLICCLNSPEDLDYIKRLREMGAEVNHALALVSRVQEKDISQKFGIDCQAIVTIDDSFTNPLIRQRKADYAANTKNENELYLFNNKPDFLVEYFDPATEKSRTGQRILANYEDFMKGIGALDDLERELGRYILEEHFQR
ncbi:hypothetical protein KY345_04675 [Candidatus Woesearchaeota archaeon]|nr:hypothetical protein [Candidatus Woesearchaeota archaeon]